MFGEFETEMIASVGKRPGPNSPATAGRTAKSARAKVTVMLIVVIIELSAQVVRDTFDSFVHYASVARRYRRLNTITTTHSIVGESTARIDLAEFKRGWHILLLAGLGVATCVTATILYGFGVLVIPLQQSFGLARADLQLSITCLFLGAGIACQFAGILNQVYGMRVVTTLSLVALSLGYLALTLFHGTLWHLYLGFAMLAIAGVGTLQVTWSHLVNEWFERNRGLALAIILSGTGLAASVLPSLLTWAIARWDWRAGFVAMAAPTLLLTLPLTLVWMRSPAQRAAAHAINTALPGESWSYAIRGRKFWTLTVALTLAVSAVLGLLTSVIPLLRDKGFDAATASAIFSSFGVSLIVGRIVVGYLLDRLWPAGVSAAALALPAIGCFMLVTIDSNIPALVVACALIGIGTGAEFDISAYLLARYFGMRDFGRLYGLLLGIVTFVSALAPALFSVLYRSSGSYDSMLALAVGCFIVGPALLLTLGQCPRWLPAGET
jgi:MFS family permease